MLRGGKSKEKKAGKRVRDTEGLDDKSCDKLEKNSPRKLSKLASSDNALRVRECFSVNFFPCLWYIK